MISVEQDGINNIVTILDDKGHDEDIEIVWEEGGTTMVIRQYYDDEEDAIITLSAMQASILKDVLNKVMVEV